MNKMKLNLDALAVESFDTSASAREKGTVFGEQCTCPTACTCPGCPTCDGTCPFTCDDYSCNGEATCAGHTCDGTCHGEETCGFSCWDTCERTCGV
jgi:hypothetical protein